MADDHLEERSGFLDGLGFGGIGDGLGEDLVHLVEVTQQDRLGTFELVGLDVVLKRLIVL